MFNAFSVPSHHILMLASGFDMSGMPLALVIDTPSRVFGLGSVVKIQDQGYWLGLGSKVRDCVFRANRG